MASALIALGGNVGDVRARFNTATDTICREAPATLTARSADYETAPWGGVAQPSFINACIAIETERDPRMLLATLHAIERMFGRDRARETRWGPRTLDLDLITYDDIAIDTPELILPHPRLFERAFVLVPLADIAPDRVIAGCSVREALSRVSRDGIARLPDLS
jgi:2-amino-4-hydroxy-6-hydroxymethyldihydropteridine diphosphokinase